MSDVIELRELRVSAIVGRLRRGARPAPSRSAFDLDIERPFEAAAVSDDLAETTNYADGARARRGASATEGQLPAARDPGVPRRAARCSPSTRRSTRSRWRCASSARRSPEDVATVGVRCTLRRA